MTATRLGRRPNGERLIPVHAYAVFDGMAAEDHRAVVTYVRTEPPVNRAKPPKKIAVPLWPQLRSAFNRREES